MNNHYSIVCDQPEVVGNWVCSLAGGEMNNKSSAVGLAKNGDLVAGVIYGSYNGASVFVHTAIEDKTYIPREYLWYIFHYPFHELNCRLLVANVASDNVDSRRYVEHLGFRVGSTLVDGSPQGDLIVYVMRRSECRWLSRSRLYLKGRNGEAISTGNA